MKTFANLKTITVILVLSCSVALNAQTGKPFFQPEIKYEKAVFSGKITGFTTTDTVLKPIKLSYNNIITADRVSYDVAINRDGSFSISIPVQCICLAVVQSEYFENPVCLIPGKETRLEISYTKDQSKQVKLINSLNYTTDDALNIMEVIDIATTTYDNGNYEVLTPEIFSQKATIWLNEGLNVIENTDKLTGVAKQMAMSELKAWFISTFLFDYGRWATLDYINQHKSDSIQIEFLPQIPSSSYYSFLNSINFCDPINFTAGFYSKVLQLILNNDTLAIPAIGDLTVGAWLIKAKEILKDDIGIDTGLFYDVLAANAFAKQLNEMKPLSEIQKNNIQSFFSNKSIVSILLDENERVIKLSHKNSKASIKFMDESFGNVLDSILSKYKGDVVFVDFWATWCAPCLKAMKESENIRKEFKNKDVVFVYITDHSSPRKAWEQKISEISGEHYYLSEKEWDYLQKTYDFTGIPHYLIFDKSGILKYNYHTYMGNKNMRKWIEESL